MAVLCALIGHVLARCSDTPKKLSASEVSARPVPLDACEKAVGEWCGQFLKTVGRAGEEAPCMAVAYSAGADSTALLLAVRRQWQGRLVALHVHHGLQAAADGFEACTQTVCASLDIELHTARVDASPSSGQSPEDAARITRYVALADLARQAGADCVLLGQHADDQAETLLLALSRGAGLPGLAAMPGMFTRHGMCFGRPFLDLPGAVLRAYVESQSIAYVTDPTNADERYTRNRIRAVLSPAWERCFPGYRPMLLRSARHAAQAQELLDDLARLDLDRVGSPPIIATLQTFGRERQANAVRYWLRNTAGVAPSAAQLEELLDQVASCTTRGHAIRLKVANAFVSRAGDRLAYGPSI
jgi:tRNA(Ile)-lysidine synthase